MSSTNDYSQSGNTFFSISESQSELSSNLFSNLNSSQLGSYDSDATFIYSDSDNTPSSNGPNSDLTRENLYLGDLQLDSGDSLTQELDPDFSDSSTGSSSSSWALGERRYQPGTAAAEDLWHVPDRFSYGPGSHDSDG